MLRAQYIPVSRLHLSRYMSSAHRKTRLARLSRGSVPAAAPAAPRRAGHTGHAEGKAGSEKTPPLFVVCVTVVRQTRRAGKVARQRLPAASLSKFTKPNAAMPTHADSTHPTIQPLRYQAPLVFSPQMSKENYVRNTKKSRRTTSEPAVLALGPKQGTFKGFPTRSGTLFPPFFQISELYLKRLQRVYSRTGCLFVFTLFESVARGEELVQKSPIGAFTFGHYAPIGGPISTRDLGLSLPHRA